MNSDHRHSRPASHAAGRPGHPREIDLAVAPKSRFRPSSRHAALTLVVDLIGPIALYYGLRAAGTGIFLALIIGAAAPALNAAIKLIRDRRVDGLAVGVLAIMLLSTAAALIGGSPRFLLAKDGWLTAAWGVGFFASLRGQRPLTFLFARPLLEGRKVLNPATRRWSPPTNASWDDLWEQVPRFRRIWQVATMIWGIGTLIDAIIRLVMAYTLPVNVVPGLGGALWPVTFVALQVITNIYFARSGLWLILLGQPDCSQQPGDPVKPHTGDRPNPKPVTS